MKSVTLLKVLGVCAVSSLAAGGAQAADNCLSRPPARAAVSAEAGNVAGHASKRGDDAAQNQDLVATITPLVGGMAKTGLQTASTVMRAVSHTAASLFNE
jgi:hypothetical protein